MKELTPQLIEILLETHKVRHRVIKDIPCYLCGALMRVDKAHGHGGTMVKGLWCTGEGCGHALTL